MHKLERNLIDNILESEVKLGRIGTSLTLYYPGSSLAELLDCSEEELPVKLAEFPEKGTEYLGNIVIEQIDDSGERFSVRIPAEGLDRVYADFQPSDFTKEFVKEIRNPGNTLEDIAELFHRYSQDVVINQINPDEWVFSFCDDAVDAYVYHIEQNVFGLEYHRFTKESYRKMMNDMAEERKKR